MYTSGARVSNAWVIYPQVGDNFGKLELIPDKTTISPDFVVKGGCLQLSPKDEFTFHQVVGEVRAHQA